MNKYIILLFSILFFTLINAVEAKDKSVWEVRSPDSKIQFKLKIEQNGQLFYEVFSNKNGASVEIIEKSPLGLIRKDQSFDVFKFLGVDKLKKINENYFLLSGKQLQNQNRCTEQTVHFENTSGSKIDLVVRAYNDGVAFKYVFPEISSNKYTVTKELTGFNLPEDGLAWIQPYDKPSDYSPAYEKNYEKGIPIASNAPTPDGWAFPALFEVKKHWVLLTEANLNDHFYGSHLNQDANKGLYTITHPHPDEAIGYGTITATSNLPWIMPWRVIFIGNRLADIVESNLVHHLSDPSVIEDASWIKPGRSSWAWWSGYLDKSNDTPEKLKKFIDFAQKMNWEYSLIDAGWESREGLNTAEIIQYANAKKVDLLLWYNSGGPTNKVDAGPRDLMFDAELRQKEMKRIVDLGYKGIKIDFFGSDKQELIKLYIDILKDAAQHKLLVNFHGCTLPRGWSRTYPHLIALEAVKGSEGYIYHPDFEDEAPLHNTVLPFTRNVVGPMDYTPTAFSFQQFRHKTTFAHELALSVVFEAGIQHYPDTPESYLSLPIEVQNFMKQLPAAWHQTKLLSGYPAKEVVIARKNQSDWFVGGINGENTIKETTVDFSFLEDENYEVLIIGDGENTSSFSVSKNQVTKKSKMKIKISPFGGFVMKINKIKR